METIRELSIWVHKREGYQVEVGPRSASSEAGKIVMKDANDARFQESVMYRRIGEDMNGATDPNVYVRTEADFLAKFEPTVGEGEGRFFPDHNPAQPPEEPLELGEGDQVAAQRGEDEEGLGGASV